MPSGQPGNYTSLTDVTSLTYITSGTVSLIPRSSHLCRDRSRRRSSAVEAVRTCIVSKEWCLERLLEGTTTQIARNSVPKITGQSHRALE